MAAAADLLAAVKAGDAAAVAAIVASDPELAGAHENGVSAVRIALYHRQPAALEALLAAQPPLDGLDHAALGWADDLRRDLAADPDLVSRRSADGFTALHYACFLGGAPAVAALLEAGADPDADAVSPPVRPLHSAAAARDADSIRLLLEAGADPNAKEAAGFTPLHAAAHHDDEASAALLLRYGADPALRNDDGADVVAIARAASGTAVLALLGGAP
jgi:ankyrin repeat protein